MIFPWVTGPKFNDFSMIFFIFTNFKNFSWNSMIFPWSWNRSEFQWFFKSCGNPELTEAWTKCQPLFNTHLRLGLNGYNSAETFSDLLIIWNICILIKISLKLVPRSPINANMILKCQFWKPWLPIEYHIQIWQVSPLQLHLSNMDAIQKA